MCCCWTNWHWPLFSSSFFVLHFILINVYMLIPNKVLLLLLCMLPQNNPHASCHNLQVATTCPQVDLKRAGWRLTGWTIGQLRSHGKKGTEQWHACDVIRVTCLGWYCCWTDADEVAPRWMELLLRQEIWHDHSIGIPTMVYMLSTDHIWNTLCSHAEHLTKIMIKLVTPTGSTNISQMLERCHWGVFNLVLN